MNKQALIAVIRRYGEKIRAPGKAFLSGHERSESEVGYPFLKTGVGGSPVGRKEKNFLYFFREVECVLSTQTGLSCVTGPRSAVQQLEPVRPHPSNTLLVS